MASKRQSSRPKGRNEGFFSLSLHGLGIGPHRLWLGVFAIWALLLSGLLEEFTGTPGVVQSYQLGTLLEAKRLSLARAEDELVRLRQERDALDANSAFQEREIRRILGYVAPDELVFDFSGE